MIKTVLLTVRGCSIERPARDFAGLLGMRSRRAGLDPLALDIEIIDGRSL